MSATLISEKTFLRLKTLASSRTYKGFRNAVTEAELNAFSNAINSLQDGDLIEKTVIKEESYDRGA